MTFAFSVSPPASTTHLTTNFQSSFTTSISNRWIFHRQSISRSKIFQPNITMSGGPQRSTVIDTPKKEFLDRLKPLGKVRLITRNQAAIMEAIATFDGLFFATVGSGEYGNIVDMSINLDIHLLLSAVSGARFETGVSRTPSKDPTYVIRILGADKKNAALSVFLQWDKEPSDIAPERIEAWKKLKEDYVKDDSNSFFFEQ